MVSSLNEVVNIERIELGNITLYRGDCLEIMPTLPRVSTILTDPPYMSTDIDFDKRGFDIEKWSSLCMDILEPSGYLVMMGTIELLGRMSILYGWETRFTGVWLKQCSTMRTHNAKKPMSRSELYAFFVKPGHKISDLAWKKQYLPGEPYRKVTRSSPYKRGGKDSISRACTSGYTVDGYVKENFGTREQTDVIDAPNKSTMKHSERTDHPTQKPVKLMEILLGWCGNGTVCDPFGGSGSTVVACANLGIPAIGIELDPTYFDMMVARVKEAQQQPLLFQKEFDATVERIDETQKHPLLFQEAL